MKLTLAEFQKKNPPLTEQDREAFIKDVAKRGARLYRHFSFFGSELSSGQINKLAQKAMRDFIVRNNLMITRTVMYVIYKQVEHYEGNIYEAFILINQGGFGELLKEKLK